MSASISGRNTQPFALTFKKKTEKRSQGGSRADIQGSVATGSTACLDAEEVLRTRKFILSTRLRMRVAIF
eukprot:COSAG02_NODE_1388_length_12920_cov_8.638122_7_plen_70_part_00